MFAVSVVLSMTIIIGMWLMHIRAVRLTENQEEIVGKPFGLLKELVKDAVRP